MLGPQRPQAEGRVVQARRRHEPGGDERGRSSRGGPVVGVVTAHAASIGRTGDQQWALSIAPAIAPWWPRNSAIVPTCVLYVSIAAWVTGLVANSVFAAWPASS